MSLHVTTQMAQEFYAAMQPLPQGAFTQMMVLDPHPSAPVPFDPGEEPEEESAR